MRQIDADVLKDKVIHESNRLGSYGYMDTKSIIDLIDDAPTIEPQQWIPVTERLPEEADGTVLVCMPDIFPYNAREQYVNAKHNQRVVTATYSQYSDRWYFAMGAVTSTRPIAWMPLPDPWKGESDGR